ncbi:major facilitator superfamily domain-containing protein 6 [Hyalella azteca]|uniref:Major facilitator superfamily domain-containing protein 6 n=1 Tax=Hyalella azteca TaxID=294128 RepID=A0A8B7MZK6_HYAAZ|nr:major facilitator superfamily domain-containing protein 6 [Hyalella azteca]XP_018006708.1 major facilitator superfamily domain-containing protein 6 [Hyalella azteca]
MSELNSKLTTDRGLAVGERLLTDEKRKLSAILDHEDLKDIKSPKEGMEEAQKISWRRKVWKELKPDKRLIPIKILTFLFFGGMFCVTPYFSLHMQQLGISVKEIAIIYSILPLPAIMGPVICGIIGDYVSNFKAILIANIGLTVLFNIASVFTPVLELQHMQPLNFNSSGLSLSEPFCLLEGETLSSDRMPWLCNSPCFDNSELDVFSNTNQTLHCTSVDRSHELPLSSCFLEMPDEAGCGHTVQFSNGRSRFSSSKDNFYASTNECIVTCVPTSMQGVDDSYMSNSRTFWIYFICRIFVTLFMNAAFSMMDASIMAVMLRTGGDYGKQRLVAMLSMATFPFIASCIVESLSKGPADYSYAIYLHALLLGCSAIVAFCINLDVKSEKNENIWRDIIQLMKRTEVVIFLFIIFLLGANWGFLENYLFVFLNYLKAPTYLLGLTMTFGCLTGVPMLLVSDRIVEKLGRQKVFVIGFLAYTVRMFGYSIITNPWYCFIFEALEVFTYQIMWVAAVTYFPILAPTSLLGTLTGIAGAVHYNIGRGGGALVGGFLIAGVGMVWTFRVFGVASFFFAIMYIVLHKYGLNKLAEVKDQDAENTKEEEANQKVEV